MSTKSSLKTLIETTVGTGVKVYLQPPPTIQMAYPCIRLEWSNADTKFADNKPYRFERRYSIMIIDKDPDSDIPDKIAMLPKCIFDRQYVTDNLNHSIFNMYF